MAMNIKQAKTEIMNTLRAYLSKDSLGNYMVSIHRQRPILLMGPPGIGKTQIMEQIAAETGVGLVSYTITHHTRQSAIGLPYIVDQKYDGQEVSVTKYTMSEILASVYDLIEETGQREGILFLDEINCVSETLTPVMLQFLQNKTFGNRKLPEGWLVVAAGNPTEYNKSAHDFDIVTLDRVKRIDVVEDFAVWKEYAYRNGLHGAVISYLDIKKENFYRMEQTMDGMRFATARGWEDLSELILAYEKIGLRVDRSVVEQYVQFPIIAKDFANYLDLYYKYQSTYHVEAVLSGNYEPLTVRTLQTAPFDEKLAVMGLIYSKLAELSHRTRLMDAKADRVFASLKEFQKRSAEGIPDARAKDLPSKNPEGIPEINAKSCEPALVMEQIIEERLKTLKLASDAKQINRENRDLALMEIQTLEGYAKMLGEEKADDAMEVLRREFQKITGERESLVEETTISFDHAFTFLEKAVGQHQEMVLFVTEVTAGFDTSWFVQNFGCDAYYRHNRELLFDDVEQRLRGEIRSLRSNGTIKEGGRDGRPDDRIDDRGDDHHES